MIRSAKVLSTCAQVRPFEEGDISQVADLHRRVFQVAERTSPELMKAYRVYFDEVFLSPHWQDDDIQPLVYQEANGSITGFLGVSARLAFANGRALRAAISSQFVVEASCRAWVGPKLLSAFLTGPQDLSIADEANGASRRLWEGLGGRTSLLGSMRWIVPLRPCRLALTATQRLMRAPSGIAGAFAPLAMALDAVVTRMPRTEFRPVQPGLREEDPDIQTLSACLAELSPEDIPRPEYSQDSLHWLIKRASQMRSHGKFHKVVLRAAGGALAGCYLFYAKPGGISEVLQLRAKPNFAREVLEHLLHRAWLHDSSAVSGRTEPSVSQVLADRHCPFYTGPWMLIHSKNPELLVAFDRGETSFSRLDGEWCLHFK